MREDEDSFDEPPFRVVVIEDDPDVAQLIQVLFELDSRFEVVGTTDSGAIGLALVEQLRPTAVTLDLGLSDGDGATLIPHIRATWPDTRIVVFSAYPDPFTLFDVLQLGADSYLDKGRAWADLIPAVADLCTMDRPPAGASPA